MCRNKYTGGAKFTKSRIGGTRSSIFCGENLDRAKNFMLARNKYRRTFSFYQAMVVLVSR